MLGKWGFRWGFWVFGPPLTFLFLSRGTWEPFVGVVFFWLRNWTLASDCHHQFGLEHLRLWAPCSGEIKLFTMLCKLIKSSFTPVYRAGDELVIRSLQVEHKSLSLAAFAYPVNYVRLVFTCVEEAQSWTDGAPKFFLGHTLQKGRHWEKQAGKAVPGKQAQTDFMELYETVYVCVGGVGGAELLEVLDLQHVGMVMSNLVYISTCLQFCIHSGKGSHHFSAIVWVIKVGQYIESVP